MKSINLKEKFKLFDEHWTPRILADVNDQQVKIAKVEGEFVWHEHDAEDELFLVVKGCLFIDFRNAPTLELKEGEMTVVPKQTQHRPRAEEETWILLLEPKTTLHTGKKDHTLTNNAQEYL